MNGCVCQYVVVGISEKMTVAEVLEMACNKRQLNPTDHFIRIKMPGSESYKIPEKSLLLSSEVRRTHVTLYKCSHRDWKYSICQGSGNNRGKDCKLIVTIMPSRICTHSQAITNVMASTKSQVEKRLSYLPLIKCYRLWKRIIMMKYYSKDLQD